MEIKPLSNNGYLQQDNSVKKVKEENSSNSQVDKLDLTSGQNVQKADSGKNLQKIEEKISSGFYNSYNIIELVAKNLYKDIMGIK